MEPDLLLLDEPSIGLEPRFIDMVFGILDELQHTDGKIIIMVEQNAKKGLGFADIMCWSRAKPLSPLPVTIFSPTPKAAGFSSAGRVFPTYSHITVVRCIWRSPISS